MTAGLTKIYVEVDCYRCTLRNKCLTSTTFPGAAYKSSNEVQMQSDSLPARQNMTLGVANLQIKTQGILLLLTTQKGVPI